MGQVAVIDRGFNYTTSEVCCYIILTHYGTYYTGITNSILRRWNEHNTGQSSYLSKFRAKQVVHIEFFDTRKEAARRERVVKRIGAKNYLIGLRHNRNHLKKFGR